MPASSRIRCSPPFRPGGKDSGGAAALSGDAAGVGCGGTGRAFPADGANRRRQPRLPHGCRNDELVGNRFVCAGALSGSGKTARTTLAVALRTGFHGGRNDRIGAVHPLKKKRRCAAVSLKTEGLEAFLKRKRARNLQNLPILLPDAVFVV